MSDKQRKSGIMICGHGSRDKDAEREFSRVAAGLKARFPDMPIEYGFLEFSAPNIHMGLNKLLEQGVDDIYAVPGMLFAATHARNDIPSVLLNYENQLTNSQVKIHYGSELGLHPAMIEAFQTRIYQSMGMQAPEAAVANSEDTEQLHNTDLHNTLLVVVGRGTSHTLANAEAARLTRIVNENMGFGWADTVYSGVTYPSVGAGLEILVKLGFKKIVVAPYFLFTGRLIKRIHAYIDKLAAENPDIEFIKTPYLNDHPKVIDAFEVRLREIMDHQSSLTDKGESLMQSFQRRLAAGEVEIHHHHAEFVDPEESAGSEEQHSHEHDHSHEPQHSHAHSHDHNHGAQEADESAKEAPKKHSHGVYKHIHHPLGPRSMIGENLCCCFMSQFPKSVLDAEAEKIRTLQTLHKH